MTAVLRYKLNGEWIDLPNIIGRSGVSISKVTKVGSVGLIDTYRVDYSDGNNTTFQIKNGEQGIQGPRGDIDIVTATTLNAGEQATVTKTVETDGKVKMTFGIPKGNASATIIDWGEEE